MGRLVKVFQHDRVTRQKVEIGEGIFVQYGVDYVEFENGPGNYTTAIVEMSDGTVWSGPVHLIKFVV